MPTERITERTKVNATSEFWRNMEMAKPQPQLTKLANTSINMIKIAAESIPIVTWSHETGRGEDINMNLGRFILHAIVT